MPNQVNEAIGKVLASEDNAPDLQDALSRRNRPPAPT